MSKLSNENLFLLEFLVDQVTIRAECDCDIPGELCVSFQFLDSTTLDICENDFTPDESNETCTKTGKSCLFSLTPDQITECLRNFDVCVTVLKKFPKRDNTIIGNVLVSITNLFLELVNAVENDENEESQMAKTLRDCFDIFDCCGETIGKIGIYIRMSCFGKLIITQFQMNLDDNSVLFKDKEGQSLYRYKKIKKQDGKQSGDMKACSKVYFSKSTKFTRSPERSCCDDRSNANSDDPWENPNIPSDSCFNNSTNNCMNFDSNPNYSQPPSFGANSTNMMGNINRNCPTDPCFDNMPKDDDTCVNPNCLYFNDNARNRPDTRGPNCPQQPCFNNQPPGYGPQNFGNQPPGYGPQNFGNQPPGFYGSSALPIGKSMVPCNECISSSPCGGNFPPSSPTAGGFAPPSSPRNMSGYQNGMSPGPFHSTSIQQSGPCNGNFQQSSPPLHSTSIQQTQNDNSFAVNPMGGPQFFNMSQIPFESTTTNLDPCGQMAEQMNSGGCQPVCPGLQGTNNGDQTNQNNQNSTPLSNRKVNCTCRDKPPEKTELDCTDPNKETFILRIGKKSERMNERKNKLELELCTPRCTPHKPKPQKETRECQYDINDIAGGGKKGKKGKDKGKKKKK